jgi:hypothetical protein
MKIIAHLRALQKVAARYKNNLYLRGQVERSLGLLLLAEGFLGLENPLDGKKTRPGILGALIMTIIGFVLLFFSPVLFQDMGPVENELQTSGQVILFVDEGTRTDSDGEKYRVCSLRASYEVEGSAFEVKSDTSSSNCTSGEGDEVTIGYNELNPKNARVVTSDPPEWLRGLLTIGVPILFIIIGLVTFVLRAISLAFGVFFFLKGNKKIKAGEEVPLGDLLDQIRVEGIAILQNREVSNVPNPTSQPIPESGESLDDSVFRGEETDDSGPPSFK